MASRSSAGKRKGAARTRAGAASAAAIEAGLDRLPIGFALFDSKWRLAGWNGALASICGYPKSLLSAGTPVQDFLRFNAERGDYGTGKPASLIRKRLAVLSRRKPTIREQKLADGRTLRMSTRPVPPGHRLVTFEDVSEARLAEHRYEIASRAINEGVYDWDIASSKIYFSERVYTALGFSRKEFRTLADWRARIHPEDLPRFNAGVIAHLRNRTERFECDYRFRAPDGSWRWARTHGIALRNAQGRGVRMIGSTGDINELKRTEEALKQSEERYTLAMRAATEGVYEWDLESNKLYISDTTKVFFWSKLESLTPQAWNERVHPEDFDAYRKAIAAHFKGMRPQFEHEYRLRDASGGYIWVLDRGIAVRNAAGRATRLVGAVSDITPRRLAEEKLRRAHEETGAALERQTATAEILKVIAGSPSNVQPVLDAVAASAARLCEARDAIILLREGDVFRFAAHYGTIPNLAVGGTRRLSRDTTVGRSILDGRQIHVRDLQAESQEFPEGSAYARQFGYHTSLVTPLMREGIAIGSILIRRAEIKPFSEVQMDLVTTFADQAVIAIENVRLFNETKEALEHQKASADILRIISSSPTDLRPVMAALAESAARLCEATDAHVWRREGDEMQLVASYGGLRVRRPRLRVGRESVVGRAGADCRLVHVHDLAAVWQSEFPDSKAMAEGGYRSILAAPLVREGASIGAILIRRKEVRPFSEKQLALLQTFADQAVIAIENVRLFNETTQALERQTATAEILKVIASSPSDAQPAFEAIVGSAVRLVSARACAVTRIVGGTLHLAAHNTVDEKGDELLKRMFPFDVADNPVIAEAVATRDVAYISDTESDPRLPPEGKEVARGRGYRSMLHVPLVKDGVVIGLIHVTRVAPGAFTQHHIALLKTFADQAVIAIENVRLFNETKDALERQTATAEILRVISSTQTDTQPVFDAIVSMAFKLFSCSRSAVLLRQGDHFSSVATCTRDGVRRSIVVVGDIKIDPADNFPSRVFVSKRLLHLSDWSKIELSAHERRVYESGTKASLMVPLLREDNCIGVLAFLRADPIAFDEKEITLAQSFADQAVIAIENVRLFNETKEALEQQTATAEVLKAISRTTFDLDTVLSTLLESATRLSGAERAVLLRPDGEGNYLPAVTFNYGADSPFLQRLRDHPLRPGRDSITGRALVERRVVHVADVLADPDYQRQDLAGEGRFRTVAAVPMLRDGEPTGLITFTRSEGSGFTEKQLQLMTTFADQAAIAIENVRLFNETKEALEQQKASGEVLGAISSSIADTQPVFDKIIESCERLFAGRIVGLNLVGDDGMIHMGAYHGAGREGLQRIFPLPLNSDSGSGLAIVEARVVHYPDAQHGAEVPAATRQGCTAVGIKSAIFSPVLWEGRGIGAIFVGRDFVSSFSEKEIALLRTFSDQAAIAIQNSRLFREIEAKSRQLEVASHHKSQFLASMSHELRTPLNAILGFNEMILDGIYGELPEDVKAPLENMQSSGKHLLRLINNVLDLAKIEAGRMDLALSDYSVQDTVASVHSTLKAIAADKGLEFLASVPDDVPLAYGDGGRIAQCLMNLAGNSLKFTKAGKVEIAVEQKDSLLLYRVADTGIGIPPDKIGSLFTEFKQTDATIASEYGGTGLGLSISRKFIEMHGGRIWVESEPGKGSTFLFEVPLRIAQ